MSFYTSGPTVLTGLQLNTLARNGFDPKSKEMIARAAGEPDVGYVALMSQEPMFSLNILEIDQVLSNFGFNGKSVGSGGDFAAFTQYWTQMQDEGDRVSGAAHLKADISKGIIVPTNVEAAQDQYATAEVDVHAIYDGTNQPVVWTSGVSLPGSIAVGNLFTVGPVVINGATLPPEVVHKTTLSLGVELEKFAGSGEPYPRRAHVKTYMKQFTVETKRGTNLSIYGVSTKFSASAPAVYFRKVDPDGVRIADATAAHIKLTLPVSQGIILPQALAGENNSAHGATIRLIPRKGSASILTYGLAAMP